MRSSTPTDIVYELVEDEDEAHYYKGSEEVLQEDSYGPPPPLTCNGPPPPQPWPTLASARARQEKKRFGSPKSPCALGCACPSATVKDEQTGRQVRPYIVDERVAVDENIVDEEAGHTVGYDGQPVGLFEELDGAINEVDDDVEVEVDVAADSGACAHVFGPDDLPGNVKVKNITKRRFHGANNSPIEHHGGAVVHLVQEDGTVATSTVQVAEVCRPLHSVSTICDGKKEMLYTDEEAVVVPKGSLSKFLAQCQRLATYPRVGGLYVARVKVRNPQSTTAVKSEDFPRPGRGR